jgi:CheY-like chemotaxis protein
VVRKIVPADMVYEFFERPLEMEKFLGQVELCLIQEAKQGKRKSILIIDDDVQYMSMISDWLKENYRVSMANSGMNAIAWFSKNTADLILLDYEMPITTGPQVLQMIQSSVKTADIPVMFLTGKSDKQSIMAVLSLKPAGYLLKSIDKDGLNKTLDEFFAKQKAEKLQ